MPMLRQRRIRLRRPGGARLAVAGRRRPENARHIADALLLAAIELGHAVVPPGVLEVDRNRRLAAVRVRVIADLVLLERGDHVASPALFQHARLLADDLERRPDPSVGQRLRNPLRRVVILRQDVVLRVEPERDVNRWMRRLSEGGGRDRHQHEQRGDWPQRRREFGTGCDTWPSRYRCATGPRATLFCCTHTQ